MFFGRKSEDGIVGNYADALKRIKELEKENQSLKDVNETYQKRLETEFDNSTFSIDWTAIKAFSVERNWNNGFPTTIIGYMLTEPAIHTEGDGERVTYKDVVREWTLHCSASMHEKLVEEFNQQKKKNNLSKCPF